MCVLLPRCARLCPPSSPRQYETLSRGPIQINTYYNDTTTTTTTTNSINHNNTININNANNPNYHNKLL